MTAAALPNRVYPWPFLTPSLTGDRRSWSALRTGIIPISKTKCQSGPAPADNPTPYSN